MQPRLTCLLAALVLPAVAFSGEPQLYRNTEYGFRLQPPAFPGEKAFGIAATPVSFQSAVKDGTAASCNVQIQNMDLSPARYRELSLNQFKAVGLAVDGEEARRVSGKEAVVWRYSGSGIKAIALAVFASQRIYLTTCLAPEARFDDEEARFLATIDSFALE